MASEDEKMGENKDVESEKMGENRDVGSEMRRWVKTRTWELRMREV